MEKPAFLNTLKDKFAVLKDSVVSWVKENKKLAIMITSLFFVILLCIILLLCIAPKEKKSKSANTDNYLELKHELLVPDGPELPRDYIISREPKNSWSEKEAERWFSIPSETDIEGLSKANENLIDEILGGTP